MLINGPEDHLCIQTVFKDFCTYFKLGAARRIHGDWVMGMLIYPDSGEALTPAEIKALGVRILNELDAINGKEAVQASPAVPKVLKYADYGWLTPEGKYLPTPFAEHNERALEIIEQNSWGADFELKKQTGRFSDYEAVDYLCKYRNYVLFHGSSQEVPRLTKSSLRTTKAQREFIFEFYLERNLAQLAYAYFNEMDAPTINNLEAQAEAERAALAVSDEG